MGYHLRTIKKQNIGTIEKILEEVEEYQDAMEQGCKVMALLELSDIYGALELVAEKHNVTMDDLRSMATVTRRAFEDGSRKSYESILDRKVFFVDVGSKTKESDFDTDDDIKESNIKDVVDELIINGKDLRVDMFNTHKGVKITHIPTGNSAESYDYETIIHNHSMALYKLAKIIFDERQQNIIDAIKKRFKEPLKSPGVPYRT